MTLIRIVLLFGLFIAVPARAADVPQLKAALTKEILGPRQSLEEVQAWCERKVPPMPVVATAAEWQAEADRMRANVLDNVVFRGEAAAWRLAPLNVEWQETIPGGPGYHIKKLRYEAVPGLWIPALLYEPDDLDGKTPVFLNVNGHEAEGKAVLNKQLRCINLVKRGIITLNPDWLGIGQLKGDGFQHYRMNQLDLCGTSGLSVFFLAMQRGLDVLLSHEHADPERVGVAGLSGGGWQTIVLSSLDTRVTLANPVAGYSSFRTRARHFSDLGDSEQTPADLATVADYAHLTAMLAPRPALLTYNAQDNCCFASPHALPPLLEAGLPIYRLFGAERRLRSHVNYDPGTHNFDQDNREALYRMLADHFFAGASDCSVLELPTEGEVKTAEELFVQLPPDNADFNSLARTLAKGLPREHESDQESSAVEVRKRLAAIVRAETYELSPQSAESEEFNGLTVTWRRLKIGDGWTVPAVEFVPAGAKRTAILVLDAGRAASAERVAELLAGGEGVLAVDPFYLGESRIAEKDFLFALLLSAVGDRPLGVQASQLAAIARWLKSRDGQAARLVAYGEQASLAAVVAAGLEERAIADVQLHEGLKSLHDIIERNGSVDRTPSLFCFGLLAEFDIPQLKLLAIRKR